MSGLDDLTAQFETELLHARDERALEELRVRFVGKKGLLTAQFKEMGALSSDERPARGAELNLLKEKINQGLEDRLEVLRQKQWSIPTSI